ncbi:MAG TPA: hypothetical protein VJT75_16350 [Thermoleophilaceae bacterium]|nr:hypothetical protein [Thermoleophilaceae bacterium]
MKKSFARKAHRHDPRYVNEGQPSSVGPVMIKNTQRSIQLPLGSFTACGAAMTLDYVSAADAIPDFFPVGGTAFAVRFDDTAGSEDMNTAICTQIIAPPDGVSTVGLRLVASKNGDAPGATEQVLGEIGGQLEFAVLNGAATGRYLLPAAIPLQSGNPVPIRIFVNANGPLINDAVDVHAVDLVYIAQQ